MQVQAVRSQSGALKAGIIIATLITAGIHLYLTRSIVEMGMSPTMFILNALGYIGLLAAYLIPQSLVNRVLPAGLARSYRSIVRYVFIGYTLLTIVLWVIMGMRTPIAYVDKLAEVALVVLLWLDRH